MQCTFSLFATYSLKHSKGFILWISGHSDKSSVVRLLINTRGERSVIVVSERFRNCRFCSPSAMCWNCSCVIIVSRRSKNFKLEKFATSENSYMWAHCPRFRHIRVFLQRCKCLRPFWVTFLQLEIFNSLIGWRQICSRPLSVIEAPLRFSLTILLVCGSEKEARKLSLQSPDFSLLDIKASQRSSGRNMCCPLNDAESKKTREESIHKSNKVVTSPRVILKTLSCIPC